MPLEYIEFDENKGNQPEEGIPEIQEGALDSPVGRSKEQNQVEGSFQVLSNAQHAICQPIPQLQHHFQLQQRNNNQPGARVDDVNDSQAPGRVKGLACTDDFGTGSNGRIRLFAAGQYTTLINFGAANDWRHFGVVYDPLNGTAADGGSWSLYVDNVFHASLSDSSDLSSVTQFDFQLGDSTFNNAPLQGGNLDELLIYNRVWTDFSNGIIPEPQSMALLCAGSLMALAYRRHLGARRRRQREQARMIGGTS